MPTKKIDDPEWQKKQCNHPDHAFPNMMHIPAGEVWEHTCPACGAKQIVRGSQVTF